MTKWVNLLLHLIAIVSKLKKYDRFDIKFWNGLKIETTHTELEVWLFQGTFPQRWIY